MQNIVCGPKLLVEESTWGNARIPEKNPVT
jgi:hypothetical protein